MKPEDRKWVGEEVGRQLQRFEDRFNPHGWRRALHLARQLAPFGLTATAIGSIILALCALVVALLYQAHTRVAAEAAFEQKTTDRLDGIEATLRQMQASSAPRKIFGELSKLEPTQLAKNLSALRIVAAQPTASVEPMPEAISMLKGNFLKVQEATPEYWPTLAQFLEFASTFSSPNAPPPGKPTFFMEDFRMETNGPLQQAPGYRVVLLSGHIEGVEFHNDRIVFASTGVQLRNIRFVNCVFEIDGNPDTAAPGVKRAAQMLLASNDLANASITAL